MKERKSRYASQSGAQSNRISPTVRLIVQDLQLQVSSACVGTNVSFVSLGPCSPQCSTSTVRSSPLHWVPRLSEWRAIFFSKLLFSTPVVVLLDIKAFKQFIMLYNLVLEPLLLECIRDPTRHTLIPTPLNAVPYRPTLPNKLVHIKDEAYSCSSPKASFLSSSVYKNADGRCPSLIMRSTSWSSQGSSLLMTPYCKYICPSVQNSLNDVKYILASTLSQGTSALWQTSTTD